MHAWIKPSALLVATVLLGACFSSQREAPASPSVRGSGVPTGPIQASATPFGSPLSSTSPLPSPSPVALLPVTDPGFSCRLPVDASTGESPEVGGFVTVPRGSFRPDPAATLIYAANGQGWHYATAPQPVLIGNDGEGLAYDAPPARWVPASPELLAADGSAYAWTESTFDGTSDRLHLTSVANGSDRSWPVPPPNDPALQNRGPMYPIAVAITSSGILISYGWEGTYGVWRLDPSNGSLTKITGEPAPRGYGAGAIWLQPRRGSSPVGAEQSGDTLARLDPSSGLSQDWFHRDAVLVAFLGIDGDGYPWVLAVPNDSSLPTQILRVRGLGQADLILSGQRVVRIRSDVHGTWFANETGVYLFGRGRLQRVAAASVESVVGPCIA